jgi:hypothetical protein
VPVGDCKVSGASVPAPADRPYLRATPPTAAAHNHRAERRDCARGVGPGLITRCQRLRSGREMRSRSAYAGLLAQAVILRAHGRLSGDRGTRSYGECRLALWPGAGAQRAARSAALMILAVSEAPDGAFLAATAVGHCHRRSAAHHPPGRHPARPSSYGLSHPYSTDRERLLKWLRLLGAGRHPGGSAARFAPEPGRPGLPTARAAGDQMSQTGRTRRMTGAVVPAGAATGGATDRVRPQRRPVGGPLLTWMTQALIAEAGVLRTGRESW